MTAAYERAMESLKIEQQAVGRVAETLNPTAFQQAVEALSRCPKVITCASGSSGVAAKKFAHSNGQLNDTLTEVADGTLRDLGHDVRIVRADSDYDVKAEVQNFLWADVVIWQMPGWWMGAPWTVKKYIDDVFTEGHGTLYASDGRTRKDPSKKYGSGGLVQGKKYMLSLTWNAPMEAFTEKDQFFHGVGVDGVYLPFHKANQFLGMEPLPTFIANDVIKMPDVPRYTEEYRKHLVEIFG